MRVKRVLLVAGISLVLGAAMGYFVAQYELRVVRDDIDAALIANEFNYRLNLLRTLRRYHVDAKEVELNEIDALALVANVDLKNARPGSSSHFVLETTAHRLASYIADFPNSEFNPKTRPIVASILSIESKK